MSSCLVIQFPPQQEPIKLINLFENIFLNSTYTIDGCYLKVIGFFDETSRTDLFSNLHNFSNKNGKLPIV